MSVLPGLPSLPLSTPACRDPHKLCHALGLDYVVEPILGAGLIATNGAKIDTTAFAEKAPSFCCAKSRLLPPANNIKQF